MNLLFSVSCSDDLQSWKLILYNGAEEMQDGDNVVYFILIKYKC